MTTEHLVETLAPPSADQRRFCPYHGGYVLLADCPIVATNDEAVAMVGSRRGSSASTAAGVDFSAEVGDIDKGGADGNGTETWARQAEGAKSPVGGRIRVRALADVQPQVGELVLSNVDGEQRLVVAMGPGYTRRMLRAAPELKAPAVMARAYGGAVTRPARACPTCLHPLPVTIDYRDTYPTVLVGYKGSSKTSTVVALIEEAGRHRPEDFGVSNFSPTEATTRYLLSIDEEIFVKFRNNRSLERTQQNVIHPPLEFLTTIGVGGPSASLLVHDVAGEALRNPNQRVRQAPSVLWADAIMFIYNPQDSPLCATGENPDQATILNGVRDDLEARGPEDASGRPYVDPALLFVVSKADLIPNCPDLSSGSYTDADVHAALRSLGDQAVINAANRFPKVHWLLIAPMPEHGGGPQGMVELLSLLLSQLR
jgi:hypothetical protein